MQDVSVTYFFTYFTVFDHLILSTNVTNDFINEITF